VQVDDEKLIDIETKLAHQEDLLASLNDALTNQQVQISELQGLCRSLVDRFRALSAAGDGDTQTHERPPHY
jgi:SlyX protein